jgi:hypothetical protein
MQGDSGSYLWNKYLGSTQSLSCEPAIHFDQKAQTNIFCPLKTFSLYIGIWGKISGLINKPYIPSTSF